MYPDDFYYTKDHEWIKIEGEEGTVGITDFAQKQLGDVVYVELPAKGTKLEFHQSLGVIESVLMSTLLFRVKLLRLTRS